MFYPSRVEKSAKNVAIKSCAASKCLRLDYIVEIEIINVDNKKHEIWLTHKDYCSDFDNGKINWTGMPSPHHPPSEIHMLGKRVAALVP